MSRDGVGVAPTPTTKRRGTMSKIYKREGKTKTTWQIYWYTPDGKLKGKTFPTYKDAKDYLAKIQVAKRERRYPEIFNVKKETLTTFNELADEYVDAFQTQKGFANHKAHVILDLRERYGDWKLSQITRKELERYRNDIKATPTPPGTAMAGTQRSDGTVNGYLSTFRHLLSKAVEWDMLEENPFTKGARLAFKLDNQRKKYLSEDQIDDLLSESLPHLKPIVETALNTGMRRGELLGLKWDQVRNGQIYLEGCMCKSGKGRQIPVNERLDEIFRELRQKNQLISAYVFCDSHGRRYKEVTRSFKAACKRAGIEDFRFHDLRHTFASRLVMNGVNLKAIQELLGHANITMTMRYAHLSQAHLRDAVGVLDNLPSIKETLRNPAKGEKVAANSL